VLLKYHFYWFTAGALVVEKQRTDLKLGSGSEPGPVLPWWKSCICSSAGPTGSSFKAIGVSRVKCPFYEDSLPDHVHFHQKGWGHAGILCQQNVSTNPETPAGPKARLDGIVHKRIEINYSIN